MHLLLKMDVTSRPGVPLALEDFFVGPNEVPSSVCKIMTIVLPAAKPAKSQ
jgi:hypothetical protein